MLELSVIVPTYNGVQYLSELLRSVVIQSTDFEWELLIIDDGSTDKTSDLMYDYISRYPGLIRYERLAHVGLPGAKNKGVTLSKADVLLFLDDDMVLPSDLFQRVRDYMKGNTADIVGLIDLPRPGDTYIAKSLRYFEIFSRGRIEKGFAVKAVAAIRRVCFEKAGLFNEGRVYYQAEDTDFNERCKQLGLIVKLAPALSVYHRAENMRNFARKSLLSMRNMGVPRGFAYYRVGHALFGLLMALVIIVLLMINVRIGEMVLIIIFFLVFIASVLISKLSAGTVTFAPGVLLAVVVRVGFIFLGAGRYVCFKARQAG